MPSAVRVDRANEHLLHATFRRAQAVRAPGDEARDHEPFATRTETMMPRLTRNDVLQVVGELDEQIIADVIATGANQSELELAVERLRDNSWIDREVEPNVVAVCDVLAPVLMREEEEFYATD